MLKRLWCWLFGHNFWVYDSVKEISGYMTIWNMKRVERCQMCDKKNAP